MATKAIDNLEDAIAVLNERRWRGWGEWKAWAGGYATTDDADFNVDYPLDDAIAIANSLVLAERCAELEAQHAAWLIEKAELTAQVEGLIAERDAWRLAVQKL